MLRGYNNLEKIQDQSKRTNVLSKRRRNLVKKTIELSNLCDVETILVVRDKKNHRITLYESSPDNFSIDEAKKLLDAIKNMEGEEALKYKKLLYTNENYMNVKEDPAHSA